MASEYTSRPGNHIADPAGDLSALPLFAAHLPMTQVDALVPTSPRKEPEHAVDVDWTLVAALRAQASEQLSQAVAADRGRLDKAAQEELGRSIVLDLIGSAVAERADAGETAWPAGVQESLARRQESCSIRTHFGIRRTVGDLRRIRTSSACVIPPRHGASPTNERSPLIRIVTARPQAE